MLSRSDATIMTPVAWAQGDTIPSHLFLQEKFPQFLPCTRTEPPYVRRWIGELSLPSFKNIIGNMILLSTFCFLFFFLASFREIPKSCAICSVLEEQTLDLEFPLLKVINAYQCASFTFFTWLGKSDWIDHFAWEMIY